MNKLLEEFLIRENAFRSLWGEAPIELPLTEDAAAELMNIITSKLEPEVLHMDGERSRSEAAAVAKDLKEVYAIIANRNAPAL